MKDMKVIELQSNDFFSKYHPFRLARKSFTRSFSLPRVWFVQFSLRRHDYIGISLGLANNQQIFFEKGPSIQIFILCTKPSLPVLLSLVLLD